MGRISAKLVGLMVAAVDGVNALGKDINRVVRISADEALARIRGPSS
jgi:hypothetical protein